MTLYDIKIYEKFKDLINSGKNIEEFDNNDLCKIFEYYSAIMLSIEYGINYLVYDDIDPDFKELNKMSRNDTGIDLCNLIDTIVQCKLRKGQLSWKECSTFFGSQNIYCENEKKTIVKWSNMIITRNADSVLSKNLIDRKDMFIDKVYERNSIINYCQQLIQNPPEYPSVNQTINLRDYQLEAIELIKNNENVIISLPTGTGKNMIIINSFERNEKYLILVPRIVLMEQLKEEMIKFKSSLKTKIQTIGDKNNKFNETKLITICVYNSIDIVLPYCSQFKKIYIDEGHNINKPEIYKIDNDEEESYSESEEYSDDFSLESSDETSEEVEGNEVEMDTEDEIVNNTYVKKIKELEKYNNNVYLSATIDETEGYIYYKKDIREMITNGYLCDYDIRIPIFSDKANDSNICEYLVKNYRSIIIYCNTQKEGKKIKALLETILPNSSSYIDCKTSKIERNKIIKKYNSGEIAYLVNVRTLIEGFNAPITNGVCFMHMPKSKTKIIQIIGRALRLHPLKTIAHVILPYSTDEDKDEINYFLKVLSRNDSRIYNSYSKKELGGYISIENIIEDDENDDERNDIELKYEKIYDSFGIILNRDELFMTRYNELKEFVEVNGRLPSNKKAKNNIEKSIGGWSACRRRDKRNNKLSEEKIKLLEEIPYWYWEKEDTFYKNYQELKEWVEINKKLPTESQHKFLSNWCQNKKTDKRKNKLTEEKIKLLEEIPGWYWKKEAFYKNYEELKEWIEVNKKLPCSRALDLYEKKWGKWCIMMRLYKRDNKLSEEQIKLLENLPEWYWGKDKIEKNKTFIEMYNLLKEWVEVNNRIPTNKSKALIEKSIGSWSACRRRDKRNNKLSEDKIKLLEELPGWYWDKEDTFYKFYEELKEWIEINKKLPTESQHKFLSNWCQNKRTDKKNNKLSEDKIKLLEELPGWYWDKDVFIINYKKLKEYIEINKKLPHCKSKDEEENKLGSFCRHHREYKRNNKLSEDKIKLLEELPGWFWDRK